MNVEKKVREILRELSSEKVIENSSWLQRDLALDSLSMVVLLIEIENVFGIELDETDMNPFDLNTVGNVIDMVKKYIGGDKNEKMS